MRVPSGISLERAAWGSLFLTGAPWERDHAFESVEWLHNRARGEAFTHARAAFDVEWVPAPFDASHTFTAHAQAGQWLACVAHQDPPPPDVVHCVCVGNDGHGLFRIETSFASSAFGYAPNGGQRLAAWSTLGARRLDALLFKPKAAPLASPGFEDQTPHAGAG